ncbi:hypothetical protein [Pseudomonas sp. NPDC089569]|uniref:hypothetical protein n=1 Tax=Pseudomonas sp. NPDC089569 TaxID=3390722 RepID=UPI003D04FEA0
MTDNRAQDEMRAARQDMAQLLNDIVIAPLKSELTSLLDGALYPLDKKIKDGHEGLTTQVGRLKRTLDRHYPDTGLALGDQIQALLDGQYTAQDQAQARANDLAAALNVQAQTLNQQTLQALLSQTHTLDGLLNEHQQALQTHTQAQLLVLNDANRLAHRESNEQLFEQLTGLADAQQSAETLAVARTDHLIETLSTQAESLGQQTLQAVYTHSHALEGQLNDHRQTLQSDLQTQLKMLGEVNRSTYREGSDQLFEQLQRLGKERTKRLEALVAVLASQGRTAVQQAIAQQEQRVQATLCAQAMQASTQHESAMQMLAVLEQRLEVQGIQTGAQHESTLQTLAVIEQHLRRQEARVDDLQAKLQRTARHAKALLFTCIPMSLLSLGALAYLILHIG